jgi:hypothetical protein
MIEDVAKIIERVVNRALLRAWRATIEFVIRRVSGRIFRVTLGPVAAPNATSPWTLSHATVDM